MRFIELDEVLVMHSDTLQAHGGTDGIRDAGLLDSALAQPRATFDGQFLHRDVYEMAAAYLFHTVQNHPFVDGNKRTGLICCLTFLELNGVETHTEPRLYDLTMDVASGIVTKADIAAMLASMFPSNP